MYSRVFAHHDVCKLQFLLVGGFILLLVNKYAKFVDFGPELLDLTWIPLVRSITPGRHIVSFPLPHGHSWSSTHSQVGIAICAVNVVVNIVGRNNKAICVTVCVS